MKIDNLNTKKLDTDDINITTQNNITTISQPVETIAIDSNGNVDPISIEYNKYRDISNRVNDVYSNYNTEKEPHETNAMTKMMTWYGVQMKTMNDHSNSKLSELLIQGTNMGIIEGRRLLNQNQNAEKDVKSILNDFVVMQEDSVETLKKYL